MTRRWFAFVALALATLALPAATAGADPKPSFNVTLTCGQEVVDVVVAGNGAWAPAHDLNSTLVGVPFAFGAFTGVFTPTSGAPQPINDPPFAKPNLPKTRNLIIDCTYIVSGQGPGGTVTGAGSVTIMVPRLHL